PLSFNHIDTHKQYFELAEEIYTDYIHTTDNPLITDETSKNVFQVIEYENKSYATAIANIYTGQSSAAQGLTAKQNNTGLVLLVLSANTYFYKQLSSQRQTFLGLAVLGCLLLSFFAYRFTGHLIKPLKENQEQQIQFISNASHELRTPIAVILSSVSARPPHFEQTIEQESLRMKRLINDMLTLTGIEKGASSLLLSNIEPDTFLLNFYDQVYSLVVQNKLSLSLILPDETIPPISADADKLKQLLMILLQNAITYTPEGGSITLNLFLQENIICFQIIDTGIGISDADKKRIFERYYRADNAHHKKEHFGLGLCIAKEIVLAHHGSIKVSDTPGGGSTFSCYFPVTPS
ncbi:MAG: sensor histidine kinase, partial [Acetatifactor sp.]